MALYGHIEDDATILRDIVSKMYYHRIGSKL